MMKKSEEIAYLKRALAETSADYLRADEARESLASELAVMEEQVERLDEKLADVRAQLDKSDSDNEELTEEVSRLDQANCKLWADHMDRLNDEFDHHDAELTRLENAMSALGLKNTWPLEPTIDAVVRHLREYDEVLVEQARDAAQRVEALEEENTGLHRALELARAEATAHKRAFDIVESELHDLEEDYAEVSARSAAWWGIAKTYCRAWSFAQDEWVKEHKRHQSLKRALRILVD